VLNQRCIRWDKIDFSFVKRTSLASVSKYPEHLLIKDGDILWNSTGSGTIGRAAIYRDTQNAEETILVDTHITVVRCEHCLPEYVKYFARTLHVQKIIADLNVGSTNQLELPRAAVAELFIPLPPLPEQRRIVARIDELFVEIAEGEAALERARRDLDTWRRALLRAAVTGELTREWREANPPTETGTDLLARMRASRRGAAYASQRRGRKATVDVFDETALPELPSGWIWAPFTEIVDTLRNGTAVVPVKRETNCPILRISAVRPLAVNTKDIRYLDEASAAAAADFQVSPGDLLLTRYNGSRHLVGVCGIFKGEQPVYYPDKLIRVRLNSIAAELSPFFEAALNLGACRKFIDSEIKTTAGQHGISGSSLMRAPVPIPPPREASLIISLLNEALPVEANGRGGIRAAHQLSQTQRQSILKSAFAGELVPQDPADEPVSALLARLRQSPVAQMRSHCRGRQLGLAV
jgi:type I restriction enzyme S subunit